MGKKKPDSDEDLRAWPHVAGSYHSPAACAEERYWKTARADPDLQAAISMVNIGNAAVAKIMERYADEADLSDPYEVS